MVLTDLDQERVDKGVGYVHAEIDKLLAKGRLTQDKANRYKALVSGAVDKAEVFADADFVIEAVFEEMKVKKSVFADVEKVVSPECVLATNTSSLSITEMAADLEHPERVVGFHFFNPVAVMPLLEIVQGEQTDDATLATAFATGKALKKTTILVKDSPSFIVNRLLGRFMGEVGRIVDEGTPVTVADGAFAGVAPMPPFMLLSLVGPADRAAQQRDAARRLPRPVLRLPRPRAARRGAASRSYYGPDGAIDPEVEALLGEAGAAGRADRRARSASRCCPALADEARRMLDEGVVAAPEDLDLAMITGAGFSFWNGGLTMLLDISGHLREGHGDPVPLTLSAGAVSRRAGACCSSSSAGCAGGSCGPRPPRRRRGPRPPAGRRSPQGWSRSPARVVADDGRRARPGACAGW